MNLPRSDFYYENWITLLFGGIAASIGFIILAVLLFIAGREVVGSCFVILAWLLIELTLKKTRRLHKQMDKEDALD